MGLNAQHDYSPAATDTGKSYCLHKLQKNFRLTTDLPRIIACEDEASYLEISFYYDKLREVIAGSKSSYITVPDELANKIWNRIFSTGGLAHLFKS